MGISQLPYGQVTLIQGNPSFLLFWTVEQRNVTIDSMFISTQHSTTVALIPSKLNNQGGHVVSKQGC